MRLLLPAVTAIALTAVAVISFARGAEVKAGNLVVTSAWARATPPGASTGAAYVTVENHGSDDDRLIEAATPAAGMVMAHATSEANGVSTMRAVDAPVAPAGGALAMRPGGLHLMLMHLTRPLKQGESLPLTLNFERAGAIKLLLPVAGIGADGPPAATAD